MVDNDLDPTMPKEQVNRDKERMEALKEIRKQLEKLLA